MTTNEKRREVAAKLRGLDERIDGVPLMCTEQEHDAMALSAIRVVVGKGDIFHLLADLIDRPTCSIKRGYQTTWGVCSRCGALVNAERAVSTAIEYLPTRYCPWCGKEIEND